MVPEGLGGAVAIVFKIIAKNPPEQFIFVP